MFYVRTHCVPRSKHSQPRLYKTNLLMLCKVRVAVCCEIRIKHSTQSEHHVEFLNFKNLMVCKETARL